MEFALNQAQSSAQRRIVARSTVKPNRSEVRLNPNACAAFCFAAVENMHSTKGGWVRGKNGYWAHQGGSNGVHATPLDAIADWLQFIILSINVGYAAAQRSMQVPSCLTPSTSPSPLPFSLCVCV